MSDHADERILFVDDDPNLLAAMQRQFRRQFTIVTAEGGEAGLDILRRDGTFAVVVSDMRMPRLNGIEVVRRMKDVAPQTKALMLTAYNDDDYIVALMEIGAAGYLLKTARARELVEAVHNVHHGETVLAPAIAAKVARLWAHRRLLTEQETPGQLSPREREVLELAAKGLRNKDIADKLFISVRSVEVHVNSILTKLGVSSRVEAVLYAVARGWVVLEENVEGAQ